MQKTLLSIVFGLFSVYISAQINFNQPANIHYYNPYNVTVSGNGTLYFTTDGSIPTTSSSSSVNNFVVNINQNKTIREDKTLL